MVITSSTVGLVLAAGAGRRMGMPKALVVDGDGPWVQQAADVLLGAGCQSVIVVLGARADEASALLRLDDRVSVIVADEWARGVSASLRTGLRVAEETDAAAAIVTLVDLPGLPVGAVRRVAEGASVATGAAASVDAPAAACAACAASAAPAACAPSAECAASAASALRQAAYGGRPGHPVLIGRDHWRALLAELSGDAGARSYLARHGAEAVECADLWHGRDVDSF